MPITGTLIAESLRVGVSLAGPSLIVRNLERREAGDETVGQPRTWTFIEFEVPDDQSDALADALSAALDDVGGWYCDFRSATETFVVFASRIFRYPRDDQAGRTEAEAYARSVGVPEPQLDWPE